MTREVPTSPATPEQRSRRGPGVISGWRVLLVLVLWGAFTLVLVGGSLLAARLAAQTWALGHRADLGAIAIAEGYVALFGALLVTFGGPRGLRDRLVFRFTSVVDIGLALAIWVVALFGGILLTGALTPLLGQPQSNTVPLLKQSFDPLFIGLIVPTVCLLAPACEEMLFRGALFGWLSGLLPLPFAIVLTAVVFAGAHLLPTLFPILFVFGLGATWVRAQTGSTLNSFAMHATQNTFAIALTYVALTHGLA